MNTANQFIVLIKAFHLEGNMLLQDLLQPWPLHDHYMCGNRTSTTSVDLLRKLVMISKCLQYSLKCLSVHPKVYHLFNTITLDSYVLPPLSDTSKSGYINRTNNSRFLLPRTSVGFFYLSSLLNIWQILFWLLVGGKISIVSEWKVSVGFKMSANIKDRLIELNLAPL